MNPRDLLTQGAIVTSILAMSAFLGALIIAYATGDHASITLLIGAVIANSTTTVGFWLGSSAGSQKKDERLAGQAPKGPPAASPSGMNQG